MQSVTRWRQREAVSLSKKLTLEQVSRRTRVTKASRRVPTLDPSLDIAENVPGLATIARRYIANLICDNNLYVNISMLYVLHSKNSNI
jgi:hypothetical protein